METLFTDLPRSIAIGFMIGAAIGLTGIGGGVLVMPSLIYILGVSPVPAVGTGLVFSLLAKITGIIQHHRLKNIDTRIALFFTIGSAPATLLSSHIVNYLSKSGKFAALDNSLEYAMGTILIITAILLVVQNVVTAAQATPTNLYGRCSKFDPGAKKFTAGRKAGCIGAGVLVGTLIGTTSIGGGVLVIPILMIFFGLNPAITVGTSILISIVPIILGGTVYALSKNVNFALLLPMFVGCVPGVLIGSRLTTKISQRVLRTILMVAVLAGVVSFFWGAQR